MSYKAVEIRSKNGLQAINIPKNLRIDDDRVYLKKVGNILYVIPFHDPWNGLVSSLKEFTSDFMQDREQPTDSKRESLG